MAKDMKANAGWRPKKFKGEPERKLLPRQKLVIRNANRRMKVSLAGPQPTKTTSTS